ncbi:hypothetical protein LAZ67_6001897 [Cordylochernes scorpioides]|uniref:Uncharacterized protein n=1 Tax=Cordylochernes scorpioides TaxID=51811 RepID=A0ABY6KPC8_9ARAC|nr:hypothetical protein LAZ67_6001897 [Cordylochernes scorpioides]
MAASDMRNRHHVQLLLTWSTSCIPGLGALTWYSQPDQLNPGFLVSLLLLPLLLFHPGLGPAKAEFRPTYFGEPGGSVSCQRHVLPSLGRPPRVHPH